jgi:serine/threonine protein phosphatase PrpC
MTDLALDCGAVTDTGRVREQNEDRYWVDPQRGVFLVVDGVGGEAAGERAAEIAVMAIREALAAAEPGPAEQRLRDAIAAANNRIFAEAQQSPEQAGMACVLTLALLDETQLTVGHVGDSRLYLIGGGIIRKVTNDHSPVGQIEDAGEISEVEAMAHPRRNEVFRDVGSRPRSAADQDFIEVVSCEFPGDSALLLCSDGLSDHITSRRIREIAERYAGNAEATASHLVDAANRAGGRDNITAVFVAGPLFSGANRGADLVTRPRLGVTRLLSTRRLWRGRLAFLCYGMLLGMFIWAVLRNRG